MTGGSERSPSENEKRRPGQEAANLENTDSNRSEYKSQDPKWEPVFFRVTLKNGSRACRSGSRGVPGRSIIVPAAGTW